MDETIQELTNSFQSMKDSPISLKTEEKKKFSKLNLKKMAIFGGILFFISLLISIFFLDTKYYKKENKLQIKYFLISIFCIMVFLSHSILLVNGYIN